MSLILSFMNPVLEWLRFKIIHKDKNAKKSSKIGGMWMLLCRGHASVQVSWESELCISIWVRHRGFCEFRSSAIQGQRCQVGSFVTAYGEGSSLVNYFLSFPCSEMNTSVWPFLMRCMSYGVDDSCCQPLPGGLSERNDPSLINLHFLCRFTHWDAGN